MTKQTDALANDQMRRTIMVPARVLPTIVETLFNESVVSVIREDFVGSSSFHVHPVSDTEEHANIDFTVNVWEQDGRFSVVTLAGDVLGRGTSHVELVEFLQNQGADICDPFIVNLLSAQ